MSVRIQNSIDALEAMGHEEPALQGSRTSCEIGGVVIRLALALISLLLISFPAFAQEQKKSSCIECHLKLEDPRLSAPAKLFDNDIHRTRGLSCNDCHGGDPNADSKEAAKDRSKGYLGRPRTLDIPAYCGKCHSDANLMKRFNPSLRVDQEREYYTSIHGARLKEGDQRAATCISCHSVHGIRAINDPLSSVYPLNVADTCAKCHASGDYMRGFNIPSDQFAKFKTSVHAKALYEKTRFICANLQRLPRKTMEQRRLVSPPSPMCVASVMPVRLSSFKRARTKLLSIKKNWVNASRVTATTP
jgi:hypothetical protein